MIRRIGMVAAAAMGMLVAATSAQAAAPSTTVAWSPTNTSGATYDYGPIDGVGGKTATQTFTLTNSGSRATGTLAPVALTNTSGTAFSITSDSCSGLSLGPATSRSCDVTVEYAPATSGESDSATLTATGEHANASITLSGQGGTPKLTFSPGTLTVPPNYYPFSTKNYLYDFGQVSTATVTQTFTVTNSGTGTSSTLQLAGLLPNTGFTLSNDQTSGHKLVPGGTSTFELSFSPSCTGPQMFATPLDVNAQDNGSPLFSVLATAHCAPITSVTATLDNLTNQYSGNPEFVAISSGSSFPIGVGGTLKNLSFRGNPPPLRGGGLHGFTIQIPFSMSQGSLNCDASQSYAVQLGIGGSGTCSVNNNVLTVTQNFPSSWYWYWTPGRSSGGVTYASVGSSLPPGVDCCAYVTWGTPTVTAVH